MRENEIPNKSPEEPESDRHLPIEYGNPWTGDSWNSTEIPKIEYENDYEFQAGHGNVQLTEAASKELKRLLANAHLPEHVPLPETFILDSLGNEECTLQNYDDRAEMRLTASGHIEGSDADKLAIRLVIRYDVKNSSDADRFAEIGNNSSNRLAEIRERFPNFPQLAPVSRWLTRVMSDGTVFVIPDLLYSDRESSLGSSRNIISPRLNFPPKEIGKLDIEEQIPEELGKKLGMKLKYTTREDAEENKKLLREWVAKG